MLNKLRSLVVLAMVVGCAPTPGAEPTPSLSTAPPDPPRTSAATPTVPPSPTAAPSATSTRVPTATASPTATAVPLDSLVTLAGPLCEAAYNKAVTAAPVTGPVSLLIQHGPSGSGDWQYNASVADRLSFVQAKSAPDVRTMVCARETSKHIGTYTDGTPAYQPTWDVRLLRWPEGDVIGKSILVGPSAPYIKTDDASAFGDEPVIRLLGWIVPLLGDSSLLFNPGDGHGGAHEITFAPDGTRLVSALRGVVRVWSTVDFTEMALPESLGYPRQATWSPDGTRLALISGLRVIVWDLALGRSIADTQLLVPEDTSLAFLETLTDIAWSPDGQHLATASRLGTLLMWDAETGQLERGLVDYDDPGLTDHDSTNRVAWSPEGAVVAFAVGRYNLTLWDVGSAQILQTLEEEGEWSPRPVNAAAWSPDGHQIAAINDQRIVIRDAANGQILWSLSGNGRIQSLAWSPDSQQIAAAVENRVYVWRISDRQLRQRFLGHATTITSITWSSDGHWLASGSEDGFVKMWEMATHQ